MSKREQIEEQIANLNAIRNGNLDLLQQGDYHARKLVAELCGIIKAQFPEVAMPVYDKYCEMERKAQEFRNQNNELEKQIEELEKQL